LRVDEPKPKFWRGYVLFPYRFYLLKYFISRLKVENINKSVFNGFQNCYFIVSIFSPYVFHNLFCRLQGHFGEVALTSSGAFTIEKCFTASNLSLREAIVSEMLAVRSDLSKAKQGSYLLRKLDIDGYAAGYLVYYRISRLLLLIEKIFFNFLCTQTL